MASFKVDFTDVKEFVMCGKGEHNFKITEAEVKSYEGQKGPYQKINFTCEVFGGEDSGAKVFLSLFLPNGLFMFYNKLGIPIEKKSYNLNTDSFLGKTFIANVDHELYTKSDGTTGTRVKIIETSIRKYVETKSTTDVFEEFAEENPIEDSDLPFDNSPFDE